MWAWPKGKSNFLAGMQLHPNTILDACHTHPISSHRNVTSSQEACHVEGVSEGDHVAADVEVEFLQWSIGDHRGIAM